VFPAGSEISIADIVAAAHGGAATAGSTTGCADVAPALAAAAESAPLREEVARLEGIFSASLEECDAPAAVRAILALEETIQAWSHEHGQSDALATAPVGASVGDRLSGRDGRSGR